jgi:hypothetical protein
VNKGGWPFSSLRQNNGREAVQEGKQRLPLGQIGLEMPVRQGRENRGADSADPDQQYSK